MLARHLARALLLTLLAAVSGLAQDGPAPDLQAHIDDLSDFDYATRTNAARMLRRVAPREAVATLAAVARRHPDQFVRYRALVLLTGFNDPGTPDLMRELIGDRNDRVREVVYRWFERNPNPALAPELLAALNAEQAEFVRPALVRALAALARDGLVQRALVAELGRGFDFFRSAAIEALGDHRAVYAVDALSAIAALEGPLQDDAILALGRIGDRRALAVLSQLTDPPLAVVPALQAALCLLEDGCAVRIGVLSDTARSEAASPGARRAAVAALGAVAASGHAGATTALLSLAGEVSGLREDVAVAFSAVALRRPEHVIDWVARAPEVARAGQIELLRDGFQRLEEDFAEEQFFAATRAAYWAAGEGSATRAAAAALIDGLEF